MKSILTILLFSILFTANAQQETFFNQFWNNQTYYNPAFAGLEHKMQAGAMYRNQWDPVNGAPIDIHAFYNMRLKDHWGAGINAQYGSIGFNDQVNISIPASYQLHLNERNILAFGAALGFNHLTTTGNFIPPETWNDPHLPTQGSQQHLSGHAGVAYDNSWITGSVSVRSVPIAQLGGGFGYQPVAHLYGMLRFKLNVARPTNTKLFLEANFGTDLVLPALQTNARFLFNNKLSVFGGIDWTNGVLLGGGYDLYRKFRLNYSLTMIRNNLSQVTNFTHEFAFVCTLGLNE
ncbi:PorP/SprF family type IX secretion system membrane protein [Crocinitomicaceae bacterium]|nr:PorP/SprF family type IX secretion system membrane protein [Crocinitomicaceae bacterium]MDC0257307.1 PorP/SprF family type IX secretion system membrane protein [Crocinitomicaceae bacterium]